MAGTWRGLGFRSWHVVLLMVVSALQLWARPELAMMVPLGSAPVSVTLIDTALSYRLTLFCLLPVYLVAMVVVAERMADDSRLIRYGGIPQWLGGAFQVALAAALPVVACSVAPALVTSVAAGARSADGWAELVGGPAMAGQAALLCLSLMVNLALLGTWLLFAGLALGRWASIIALGAIQLGCVMSTASPLGWIPLNFGLGVQPVAAIEAYGSLAVGIVVPTLCNALALLTAVAVELHRRRGLPFRHPGALVALGAGGLLSLRLASGDWANPTEALVGALYGSRGQLPDQLLIGVVLFAPLWWLTVGLEERYSALQNQLLRAGGVRRWHVWSTWPLLLGYPAYLLGTAVLAVGVTWLRFHQWPERAVDLPAPTELAQHWLVNHTLNGWSFGLVIFAGRWLGAAAAAGLVTLAALMAAMVSLSGVRGLSFLDVGFGSLVDGESAAAATAPLLVWLLAIAALFVAVLPRVPHQLERNLAS